MESLEPRLLLSATLLDGGVLVVVDAFIGGDDQIIFEPGAQFGEVVISGEPDGSNGLFKNVNAIRVEAGNGSDSVTFSEDLRAVNGGVLPVYVNGGDGDDTIIGGTGSDTLLGGLGADQISGGDGIDFIFGGVGNDVLSGDEGDDEIDGQEDDDSINWSEGDGSDVIVGDTGSDSVRFSLNAGEIVTDDVSLVEVNGELQLSRADNGLPNSVFMSQLISIERIEVQSNEGDDSLTIGDLSAAPLLSEIRFEAASGDDRLDASAMVAGVPIYVDGSNGNDTLIGGPGNDTLMGSNGDDQIQGGSGDDMIAWDQGDGDDVIDGGDGSDQFSFSASGSGDIITISANGTRMNFDRTRPTTVSLDLGTIERVTVNALNGADTFTVQDVSGVVGLETISYNGGDGDDTIDASGSVAVGPQLVLVGGSGADTITGGQGDDLIQGGVGDDSIDGGAGDDTITWTHGDNDDFVSGGDGTDHVVFNGSDTSGDTMLILPNPAPGAAGRVLVQRLNLGLDELDLEDVENLTVNTRGNGAALDAADTVTVVDLTEGVHLDTLTINAGDGPDSVDASEATMPVTLIGGSGVDTLIGGLEGDWIDGSDGGDELMGGPGSDQIFGNAGADIVLWSPGDGSDTVDGGAVANEIDIHRVIGDDGGADAFHIQSAGVGQTAVLIGPEVGNAYAIEVDGFERLEFELLGGDDRTIVSDVAEASAEVFLIDGGDGNDYLDASANSADITLIGALGNDTLLGGAGTDSLLGGSGDDQLDGGGGNDQVVGGTGRDLLHGGAGSDQIFGGEDNDTLFGDAGDDTLQGETGDDRLVWQEGHGSDVLNGGSGADLQIVELTPIADDIRLRAVGGRAVLTQSNAEPFELLMRDVVALEVDGLDGDDNFVISDMLAAGVRNVTVSGSAGDDVIDSTGTGVTQPVTLLGGIGNDTLRGGQANDVLEGHDGDDSLHGGASTDTLLGGNGVDTLAGGVSADEMFGEAGDDVFVWNDGDGSDFADGGEGSDLQRFIGSTIRDEIGIRANDLAGLRDRVVIERLNFSPTSLDLARIENIYVDGGDGSDQIQVMRISGTPVVGIVAVGGLGDDDLIASEATLGVVFHGGDGSDTLTGSRFIDQLSGDEGGDVLHGGEADDSLFGGSGSDTLFGDLGNDWLFAEDGDDVIVWDQEDENDVVDGGAGTDTQRILGSISGEDFSVGLTAADHVLIERTNLTTPMAIDAVKVEGIEMLTGAGNDSVVIGPVAAGGLTTLVVDTGLGNDSVDAATADISLNVSGGAGNDGLIGGKLDDSLVGNEGADTLTGNDGDDILTGGDGNDRYVFTPVIDAQTDTIHEATTGGTDVIDFSLLDVGDAVTVDLSSLDLLASHTGRDVYGIASLNSVNIENVVATQNDDVVTGDDEANDIELGGGDDLVLAGGGDDTISGGDGADTLSGESGNDVVLGGDGDDLILWNARHNSDTVIAGAGFDRQEIVGGDEGDAFRVTTVGGRVDFRKVNGTTLDLQINDVEDLDIQTGGGNDDIVVSSLTGTSVQNLAVGGNAGNDTLDLSVVALSVTLYGGTGNDEIRGGSQADLLYGEQGNDEISGGLGNDSIFGGGGLDVLEGDAGDDRYIFAEGFGTDSVVEAVGRGTDTMDFSALTSALTVTFGSVTVADAVGNSAIHAADEIERLITGSGNDHFEVDNGVQFAFGAGTVDASSGTDLLAYTNYTSSVFVSLEDGDGTGFALIEGFENVTGGAANDTLEGSNGPNIINGGPGDDVIFGLDGEDDLDGGTGDDSIDGGAGSDQVSFASSLVPVVVVGVDGSLDDGQGGADVVTNIEGVIGSAFDDTLIGGLSDDRIDGGGGSDFIDGGGGDDTLAGEAGRDTIQGGSGNNTIDGGDDDDVLIGGDAADALVGGFGNDRLEGLDGSDTLVGGEGIDTLIGGMGGDLLMGQDGDDLYVFDSGFGSDQVGELDGEGFDVMDLSAVTENLSISLDSGQVSDGISYIVFGGSEIESLIAGLGDDVVLLADGSSLANGSGVVDGGGGVNTLDYSLSNNPVTVDLQNATATGLGSIAGFNQVTGGSGSDSIFGNEFGNVLDGGGGDDSIDGGLGDDTFFGGSGNDTYVGGEGVDLLDLSNASNGVNLNLGTNEVLDDGEGGTDSVTEFESVRGTEFDDVLIGDVRANNLVGGNGDDRVEGSGGNDTILGGAGSDTLLGGGGNDYYIENPGNFDLIDDFAGSNDTIDLSQAASSLTVDLNQVNGEVQTVDGDGHTLAIIGTLENVIGGMGDDLIVGNSTANRLIGNDGVDTLIGGSSNDTLNGGSGDDVLEGGDGEDVFEWAEGDGEDSPDGGDGFDIHRVNTGDLADIISVDSVAGVGNVSRTGTSPFNLLLGGVEQLDLQTGGGNDSIVINPLAGTLLQNVNVNAGDADDDLNASDSTVPVTLFGGAGDDVLTSGVENDVLDGGPGRDTLNLRNLNESTFVDLGDGIVTRQGQDGFDSVRSLEIVLGTPADDTVLGTSASGMIHAGRGDDVVRGFGGDDTMIATHGDDVFDGGAGEDTVDYSLVTRRIFVQLGRRDRAMRDGLRGRDELPGVEVVIGTPFSDKITTGDQHNAIYAGDGNDRIFAGGGNDTIDGGPGRDFIRGEDGDDVIYGGDDEDRIFAGSGDDTVDGGAHDDFIKGERGSDVIQGGAGNDRILDNLGDNNIDGGDGDDQINAGRGTDTLSGGFGNDRIIAGHGDDLIDGNDGNDSISAGSGDDTINGNLGNDSIRGDAGNDLLNGNDGNDYIDGGSGDDVVNGNDGVDTIRGGSGDDSIQGGRGSDSIDGGGGRLDILDYSASTIAVDIDLAEGRGSDQYGFVDLLRGVEILIGSVFSDRLIGNNSPNRIVGGLGNDLLDGRGGIDVLHGDDNDDTLLGGGGRDSLIGGFGNDLLNGGPGRDLLDGGIGEADRVHSDRLDVRRDPDSILIEI